MQVSNFIVTTADNRQHVIEFKEFKSSTGYGNDIYIACYEILANNYKSALTYVDCRYVIDYDFLKVCNSIVNDIYNNRSLAIIMSNHYEELDNDEK